MRPVDPPEPRWLRDFPIRWDEDLVVTRREFSRFLAVASVGLLLGTIVTALRFWLRPARKSASRRIAGIDEVPIGGTRLFRHPGPDDRAILVRLDRERFAAYSQLCTHLACPVHLAATKDKLVCPCHEGLFSVEDGRVLGGPPPRALPKIAVRVRDGAVWTEDA